MSERIVVSEHGRIPRARITPLVQRRLQAFDERHASVEGDTVFDWSRRAEVRARNYVGVVQVPGCQIEILPKVDAVPENAALSPGRAQRNLLYMLALATDLPIEQRDLAHLRIQRGSVLEAVVCAFAARLLMELGRGLDHGYVSRRERAPYVRGRIDLAVQLRSVGVHAERVAIEYDDYVSDTRLNQILQAACEHLVRGGWFPRAERALRTCLLHFGGVEALQVRPHHFREVHLSRNSQRFDPLLNFCEWMFARSSPTPGVGDKSSFSLLFPMEQVFEGFVAGLIRRHARDLGYRPGQVHAQACGRQRWLLRDASGRGQLRLRPDIVIDGEAGTTQTVIDTKWKHLGQDPWAPRQGVAAADLYQLHAYARQYACAHSVLLYPKTERCASADYTVVGAPEHRLRIAFLDVSRDLATERLATLQELRRVLTVDPRTSGGSTSPGDAHSLQSTGAYLMERHQ